MRAACVGLGLLITLPASAQQQPLTTPTRDVDISYETSLSGSKVEQRARFAVQAEKKRIDMPYLRVHLIIDHAAHTVVQVSEQDHFAIQTLDEPSTSVELVLAKQTYRRLGADRVAGLACTNWLTVEGTGAGTGGSKRAAAPRTESGATMCLTGDGVLLRIKAGHDVIYQALRVRYGPIDPAVFVVPPGYLRPEQGAVP